VLTQIAASKKPRNAQMTTNRVATWLRHCRPAGAGNLALAAMPRTQSAFVLINDLLNSEY
jgi:hypothetical protein